MAIASVTGPTDYDRIATQLKVLADPRRLRIFDLLMHGVQCNCEIGDNLDMPPNLISHHIRVLRKAGLVDAERDTEDSRWIYYSINEAALTGLHQRFGEFFDPARIQPRSPNCGPRARC